MYEFVSALILAQGGEASGLASSPLFQSMAQFFPWAFSSSLAGQTTVMGMLAVILNILLAVAALVAILFIIISGFRYLTAQANSEQVERAKRSLFAAVIGFIVIILSFAIVRIISEILISGDI